MCADECLRDSNPEQLIYDLTAYLEPSLCERWSMQIFNWRIHNPPRVDMIHLLIKSSAQLAKPCNADLGGIPKVEKLRRGQFKSWKCKWSFAEKIEWEKPSITYSWSYFHNFNLHNKKLLWVEISCENKYCFSRQTLCILGKMSIEKFSLWNSVPMFKY